MLLKCISSFYGYNGNGSLNKKITIGSYWLYLGVENKKHKLQRLYKNNNLGNYAYVSREKVKENFIMIETEKTSD